MFGAVNDTLRCHRNQGTGTRLQTLAGTPSLSELSTEVAETILLGNFDGSTLKRVA